MANQPPALSERLVQDAAFPRSSRFLATANRKQMSIIFVLIGVSLIVLLRPASYLAVDTPALRAARQYLQPGMTRAGPGAQIRQFTQPAKKFSQPAKGWSPVQLATVAAPAMAGADAIPVVRKVTEADIGKKNVSVEHTCESSYLGQHIVAEFFLADFEALNNAKELESAMNLAAKHAGATILSSHSHFFSPHGVSCVVIVQESNLCIHTWPEFGYAAADFFTCGDTVDPWKSFEYLKEFLKAKKFNCMELKRGSTALMKNPSLLNDNADITSPLKGSHYVKEYEPPTDTEIKTGVIGSPLVNMRSKFQKILIAKNKWWGNMLFIDDCINVADRDEFIYHEMIVHVPMEIHPDPRRVLIIGGGDGGSAREVLKHPNLEKAVLVDIDAAVVENCKKHMPEISQGAFDNPKLELIIGDGIDYVKKAGDKSYDVIIVDSTDATPEGAGEVLFTIDFYEQVRRILSDNGVVATQSMMPMRHSPQLFNSSLKNLRQSFGMDNTWLYLLPMDAYLGQQSFGLGFKDGVHPRQIDKARVKSLCRVGELKYYNYNVHLAAFCLPTYLKNSILGIDNVNTHEEQGGGLGNGTERST